MIANSELISFLQIKLDKMEYGETIRILTYKKDREIDITREKSGFLLYENGFKEQEFLVMDKEQILKQVKKLQKIEFPRSNRLYIVREKCENGV